MPQYRLQTLLEIREREEQEKKDLLSEAKKRVAEEQRKADELLQEHEQMKANREAKSQEIQQKMSSGQLGVEGYLGAERYLQRLDQEIEDFIPVIKEQDKKVAFAEQEVEWAMEELLDASQNLKALEKHKEKWLEEYKKEMAAKEEMAQEEIANTIFLFGKK